MAFTPEGQIGWSGEVPEDLGSLFPTIPARIEAEFYDEGGQGVAYFDNDPENVGANYGPNHREGGWTWSLPSMCQILLPSVGPRMESGLNIR